MSLPALLAVFLILTMGMALFYFYIFVRSQKRFIQFWGLGWAFYSVSLLLLILSMNSNQLTLLEIRKIFDMLNIQFFLFGTYGFMHMQIPSFWYRFLLYMSIWAVIGTYYRFDLLSVYLPISMFQVIITGTLCGVIIKYWDLPPMEKAFSIMVFLIWGVGKAVLSIVEATYWDISGWYLLEILISNVLNFSIFIIYIQRSRDELHFAEKIYRIIAENASDAIFFYSLMPSPAFTYVTPSIERLTGYSPSDFYNNPKYYLEIIPQEEFEPVSRIFSADTLEDDTLVFRMYHKNGTLLWVRLNYSIIYEDDHPTAVEGILRDVTSVKNAEAEMRASKQSRDLLLSYISHELKMPVASIMGYITALGDGTLTDPEERTAAMNIILEKGHTLEHLITDLFQLSKLETKQFSFQFALTSACILSEEMLQKHRLDIKTAGLKLKIDFRKKELQKAFIIADTERIEQVFSNMINNAVKHSEKNTQITIRMGLNQKKDCYMVEVADQGAGIPEEDIPYVFNRFFKGTGKPGAGASHSNYASSGLGLTISKEIIDAHQGSISVKSKLGRGSRFTFTIPLYIETVE